jgi:hypothetical protein
MSQGRNGLVRAWLAGKASEVDTMRNVLLGIAIAAVTVSVTLVLAQAQNITCAAGTMVLQRAVGSPNAPMFVPAQVHAT